MPLQPTGVKAEIKDLDAFMSGLKQMNAAVAGMGKAVGQASNESSKSAPSMGALAVAMGVATGGTSALVTGALNLAGSLANNLLGAVNNATSAITSFAQEGLMLAGRFSEMENASIAIGRSYGLVDDVTREAISSLSDAGIRYDIAAQSTAQLIRNQIDLANATDLASIAQATGIIIGADSSETMGRLTHAIATGNTAMLGYMGILVKKEDIDREALETYGRTTNALTQQEKMQARVNAIIKASTPIMGVYASAMESPTKALRSLTGREIPTLGATMMQTFIPAFKDAVDIARGFVKALIRAMEEGGALYPILVNAGAAVSLVTGSIKSLLIPLFEANKVVESASLSTQHLTASLGGMAGEATKAGQSVFSGIISSLSATAEGALRWGVEIVASLAEGIISGASQFLTVAMRYVGSLLTFWMAPGSPPRIAPDIDKWGAETVNEWLGGMTKADFGVLSDIQNTLSKFLSGAEMRDLTAQLAGALGGGTGIDEGIFDTIATAAGDFGAEVSTLVRQQLMLADATEMVETAENRLRQAREAVGKAQDDTIRLTKEYNDLLRAGAPPEVLEAKLAEINASEEQLSLAQTQAKEAEAVKEQAEAVVDPLKERIELQKLLVSQLMKLTEEEDKRATSAASAAKPAKAPKIPKGGGAGAGALMDAMMPSGVNMGEEITSRISEAIEAAKAQLKEKLADIFAPMTDAWTETIQPELSNLLGEFREFADKVVLAWDAIVKWAKKEWPEIKDAIADAWNMITDAVSEAASVLVDDAWPQIEDALGELGVAFGDMGLDWSDAWGIIKAGFLSAVKVTSTSITTIIGIFAGLANAVASAIRITVANFHNGLAIVSNIVDNIKGIVDAWVMSFKGIITGDFGMVFDGFKKFWSNVGKLFVNSLKFIANSFTSAFDMIYGIVKGFVDGVVGFFQGLSDDLVGHSIIPDMMSAMMQIITNGLAKVIQSVREFFSRMVNLFSTKLSEIRQGIQAFIDEIVTLFVTWKDQMAEAASNVVTAIKTAMELKFTEIATAVKTFMQDVYDKIIAFKEKFYNVGANIMQSMKEGIEWKLNDILAFAHMAVDSIIATINDALGIESPSKVFIGIGKNMMMGLEQGLEAHMPAVQAQIRAAVTPTSVPTMARVSTPNMVSNRTSNVTIGNVTIGNDMSFAEFQTRVERAILSM